MALFHSCRKDPLAVPEVFSVAKQNVFVQEIVEKNRELISKELNEDFISTQHFISILIDVIELCEDYNLDPAVLKSWAKSVKTDVGSFG